MRIGGSLCLRMKNAGRYLTELGIALQHCIAFRAGIRQHHRRQMLCIFYISAR